MKSEWKVMSNLVNGKKVYQVYRLYDRQKVMQSGNIEISGCIFQTKEAAKQEAERLNKKKGCPLRGSTGR